MQSLIGSNLGSFNSRTAHLAAYWQNDLANALNGCDGIVICKNFVDEKVLAFIEQHEVPVYDLGYFLPHKNLQKDQLCTV